MDEHNGMYLLPSYVPFIFTPEAGDTPLCRIIVDDSLPVLPKSRRKNIRTFDSGNGDIVCDQTDDGGYQYIMRDLNHRDCCLLITNKTFTQCQCALNGSHTMRTFGLNNALMITYAFATSHHQTLLIHASLVRQNGYGYAFIAKSGTGKSTQASLWLRHIPGCDLMNDDNPVVRIIDGEAWIYGSPWSGKTPCYRNVKARLGAITRIDRQPYNQCEQEMPVLAFASLLPACSSMKWDVDLYRTLCDTVTRLVEITPVYTLHCLPDREAAIVCHEAIAKA